MPEVDLPRRCKITESKGDRIQSSGSRNHRAVQGKGLPRQTALRRFHNAGQWHGTRYGKDEGASRLSRVARSARNHVRGPPAMDRRRSVLGRRWMVVIRAGSLAEAREIAAKDPMHASGARKFTVRPWLVNEGTVTIKLNYAKGSFEVS